MQKYPTPAAPKVRRPLSPAQVAVMPLLPIFDACKRAGLPCTDETRAARVRAVNRYFNELPDGFDWINESFKELLGNTVAIIVTADAIESGLLTW
jgi:hypothetical protein